MVSTSILFLRKLMFSFLSLFCRCYFPHPMKSNLSIFLQIALMRHINWKP